LGVCFCIIDRQSLLDYNVVVAAELRLSLILYHVEEKRHRFSVQDKSATGRINALCTYPFVHHTSPDTRHSILEGWSLDFFSNVAGRLQKAQELRHADAGIAQGAGPEVAPVSVPEVLLELFHPGQIRLGELRQ
jgi:hypothetical protein